MDVLIIILVIIYSLFIVFCDESDNKLLREIKIIIKHLL